MINKNNYSEEIKKINVDELPPTLKKVFDFVERTTKGGSDWKQYDASESIKKMIDLYFQKLSELPKKNIDKKVAEIHEMFEHGIKKVVPSEEHAKSHIFIMRPDTGTKKPEFVPAILRKVMPKHQQAVMDSYNASSQREMKGVLDRMAKEFDLIPARQNSKDPLVYAHYFYGESHWWILEWDRENDLFFGFVCLNGDTQNAELGDIAVNDLITTIKIELDFYWAMKPLSVVKNKAYPKDFPLKKEAEKEPENFINVDVNAKEISTEAGTTTYPNYEEMLLHYQIKLAEKYGITESDMDSTVWEQDSEHFFNQSEKQTIRQIEQRIGQEKPTVSLQLRLKLKAKAIKIKLLLDESVGSAKGKTYLWKDHSGRGEKNNVVLHENIADDFETESWDGEPLAEWIKVAEIDETFENAAESYKRIS